MPADDGFRTSMRVFIITALAVILSSCMGENKNQVLASCVLQYRDGTLSRQNAQTIIMCMKSHGFELTLLCFKMPEPTVAACYKPMTWENKMRAYVFWE